MNNKEKKTYRVVTFLHRQELDFLDELEKDFYFTYGIHIPRAKLIEEIIEAFKNKQSKEAIEQELLEKLKHEKGLI
jgi:hypothetical protein